MKDKIKKTTQRSLRKMRLPRSGMEAEERVSQTTHKAKAVPTGVLKERNWVNQLPGQHLLFGAKAVGGKDGGLCGYAAAWP